MLQNPTPLHFYLQDFAIQDLCSQISALKCEAMRNEDLKIKDVRFEQQKPNARKCIKDVTMDFECKRFE